MSTLVDRPPRRPPRIATVFFAVVRRDLTIAARAPGQWVNPLLFFVIVVTLFPLGIGPEPDRLAMIAPGVLWVGALLAGLLSLDRLFDADLRDGSLEQFVLSGAPLSVVALGKVVAHWMLSGLPLLMLSPVLALMLQLRSQALDALMLSLLLGTPSLSLIGSIGAALTVGVARGGVLLSLLVLPLLVPVLIFGSAATVAAAEGFEAGPQLWMLAAILALSISLAPWATAAAIRIGVGSDA